MLTILDSFADRKIATPRHLIRQPVWFIAHSTRRNLRYSVEHYKNLDVFIHEPAYLSPRQSHFAHVIACEHT